MPPRGLALSAWPAEAAIRADDPRPHFGVACAAVAGGALAGAVGAWRQAALCRRGLGVFGICAGRYCRADRSTRHARAALRSALGGDAACA